MEAENNANNHMEINEEEYNKMMLDFDYSQPDIDFTELSKITNEIIYYNLRGLFIDNYELTFNSIL